MSLRYIKEKEKDKQTYIAIGDIHGCHRELNHLLTVLEDEYDLSDPRVQMIFLGDYIDRGDSSLQVINKLLEIQKKYPQTVFLKGNHEQSFLEDEIRTFNDIPRPTPEYITRFFESCPIYYETPDFLFIHGGPANFDSDLSKELEGDLLWNYIPDTQGWKGKTVVKGHTAVKKPTQLGNVLYLDSGCCFGGSLSCAIINGQTSAIEEFKQIHRVQFGGENRRKMISKKEIVIIGLERRSNNTYKKI